LKELSQEKEFYSKDLKKINAFMDPSGLTLDQVRRKL
jgi:hypothetical protein